MYGRQVALADAWEHAARVPLTPEQRLLVAIVEQAIADSWRGPGTSAETPARYQRAARDAARRFLRGQSGGGGLRWILAWLDVEWSWWEHHLLPEQERRWRAYDAGLIDATRKARAGRGPAPRRTETRVAA